MEKSPPNTLEIGGSEAERIKQTSDPYVEVYHLDHDTAVLSTEELRESEGPDGIRITHDTVSKLNGVLSGSTWSVPGG